MNLIEGLDRGAFKGFRYRSGLGIQSYILSMKKPRCKLNSLEDTQNT